MLLDFVLPDTGTYYVEVETFAGKKDSDIGTYELFLYSFATQTATVVATGDTVIGGLGADKMYGSSGHDTFMVRGGLVY